MTAMAAIPTCMELDLRAAPVGQSCVTHEGFEFVLVARQGREGQYEVWQDATTRSLWGDRSDEVKVHEEAFAWCTSDDSLAHRGGLTEHQWIIPSRADFEVAESHGFRQVLPHMPLRAVWTSSVYTPDERFAYVFSGSLGTTTSIDMRDPKHADGYWYGHSANVMARCMAVPASLK
jgi:hypothetical protein